MNDEQAESLAGQAEDIIDDGVSDVLDPDTQVQVPEGVAEQALSQDFNGDTFVADIPDWDEPQQAS